MTRRSETFFCDTSVLVAAADDAHEHHTRSLAVVSRATPSTAYCTAHALAEMYSTLSAGRYLRTLSLEQVLAIVQHVPSVFTVLDLPPTEYLAMLSAAAARQTRGGRIYDALHVHAAARCGAQVIYTWNTQDFRAVARPDMAARIRTP